MTAEVELTLLEIVAWVNSTWQSLRDAYLAPGKYMVGVVSKHVPALAAEPALADAYVIVCAAVAWLSLLIVALTFLRFAGRQLVAGYYTARRGASYLARIPRTLRVQVSAPLAAMRHRRATGKCFSEEFSITRLQLAVMIAQRRLPPGHVATAVEIAGDLGLRPGPVEEALESLRKLHLVQVAFASSDGYPGYSLTRPGEIFLNTCATSARRRMRQPLSTA